MEAPMQSVVDRMLDAMAGGHTRYTRHTIAPLSISEGDFPLVRAYEIQDALRRELIHRNQLPIGWKISVTTASAQAAVGLTEPICGFLMPLQFESGAGVRAGDFIAPGVEVEVAFRIGTRLAGPGVTPVTALRAVDGVMPALEIPDNYFSMPPKVIDYVASSVIPKAIVLGAPVAPGDGLDLSCEEVVFLHNGALVEACTTAVVMGNPVNALAWLANHLAGRGLALEPGDIVMSGSISRMLRPGAGDTIEANFTHLGSVAIHFVA
jgi:2-keto-4-pentenoate hydratase